MMVGNDSSSNKLKEGTVRSKGKTEGSSSKALQEQNVASASKSDRNEEENDNAMKGNKFCSSVLPSGSSKNETGIPCNKVNTRRVTRKHYSASKANNNGSAGENYTDNRKRRFRNEYLETEYVNRKQTSKDAVVIKNQGVKKQKTSLEEIASDLNKKGKTAKMCDKSSSSKSNQKGVTLAVVKRNDKPIVKREENCTKRTLEYENCDNDKKSGRKKIISSSSSSDSNEEQTKKRKGKVIENICLASTARETEDNSPAVIDRENEDISSTSSAKETKDNSPAVIDRENEDISSTSSAKETKGNSQAVIDRENEDISSTSIARETVDNSPAVIDRENEDISSTSNDRENKEKRNRRKKKKSSSIKEMDESYFDQLPQELVIHILHYLSYYSILRLRSTYTCFQKAAEKAEVWKGKVWKPNAFNTNTYKYELKRMPKIPEIYIPDISKLT